MPMQQAPTALVTGASRGLGRGVALELAQAGFSVAINFASNHAAAESAAAECQQAAASPAQTFPLVGGDLSDPAARREVFDGTVAAFGRIDLLVNNAGITSPGRKDITEATEEGWDLVMGVNLKGPHFLTQLVANHWLTHSGRSVLPGGFKLIFVNSVSATMASTNRGDYCISKAGLGMCAQLWALRLAEAGIQVVELRPGIMETDMTSGVKGKYDPMIQAGTVPLRRWGQPADVGKAVRSFACGDWPFCTGEVIYLDGGLHLPRL